MTLIPNSTILGVIILQF